MRAMRLTVQLTRWYPYDYSEARSHDHELELYLYFEGRQAYKLFDYGPSDLVPTLGTFGAEHQPTIYVDVIETTFPVRLVAIERDWPDADDYASGEILVQ